MRSFAEKDGSFCTIRLSPEEIAVPADVITRFFKSYNLENCRLQLWQMLTSLQLIDDCTRLIDDCPRPTLPVAHLRFLDELTPFIEAVFLIQQTGTLQEVQRNANHDAIQADQKPVEGVDPVMVAGPEQAQWPLMKNRGWKRKRKYLRSHSIWFRQVIDDPLQVIKDFFCAYDLNSFRESLYDVLEAFSADHFYQRGSPNDVLYVCEMAESMINAGYLLNEQFDSAPAIEYETLLRKISVQGGLVLREKIPSLLTAEELADPSKILSQFFAYKSLEEWKEELIEINYFALSKHPPCEWDVYIDTMAVFVWIVKLVEALYLIEMFYADLDPN